MSRALSLRPSDAQAGGFLDDVDVTLKSLRFTGWDYQGKAPLTIALKVEMEDDLGLVHEQYYSAGDPNKLAPSPDGKAIVAMDEQSTTTGLNMQTNALAFITSIVNAGFPEDKLADDISVLDGIAVHVNQVAQPKRANLKGSRDDKTYLLVTKITRLPWETATPKPAKGAPRAAGGPKAVNPANATPVGPVAVQTPPAPSPVMQPSEPTSEPSEQTVAKAKSAILTILAEKGGSVAKSKLPVEAYRVLLNDPERNTIVTMVFQDSFLRQAEKEGIVGYDGETVTLG